MLVMDGLGGLPRETNGPTELEFAKHAQPRPAGAGRQSRADVTGRGAGITPGIGPAHLALFGYDRWCSTKSGAACSNRSASASICSRATWRRAATSARVDATGNITDRRAGRIPTSKCVELCEKLRPITLPGVEVFVEPVQRLSLLRWSCAARGWTASIEDTDPQRKAPPLPARGDCTGGGAHGRADQPVDRQGARDPQERASRQCAHPARLSLRSRPAPLPRSVRAAIGVRGGLPDVQGRSAAGGHGRDRLRRRDAGG